MEKILAHPAFQQAMEEAQAKLRSGTAHWHSYDEFFGGVMETRFEAAFLKALKKHASIKKLVKKKVDMIIENPVAIGEPLKGNWHGI